MANFVIAKMQSGQVCFGSHNSSLNFLCISTSFLCLQARDNALLANAEMILKDRLARKELQMKFHRRNI